MPIEPKQLSQLLDHLWPVLVTWAERACDDAEDVVQAAFIKLAAEEPEPDNCAAWLFTVVRRLSSNARLSTIWRKRREQQASHHSRAHSDRRFQRAIDCSSNDPQQCVTDDFELRELLDQLDDREREIIVARVWGELSFEQVAVDPLCWALNGAK